MTSVLCVGVPRSGTTWVARVLARASGAAYVEEPDNHFRFAYAYRAKRRLGMGQYPWLSPVGESVAASDYGVLWEHAFASGRSGRAAEVRQRAANRLVENAGVPRVAEALRGGRASPRLALAAALAVPQAAGAASSPAVLVKSVYAPLAAEWIAARQPVRVVVVLRHPLNVVSSWIALGWTHPDPVTEALTPGAARELAERFGASVPPSSAVARTAWLVGVLTCELEAACRRNPTWAPAVHEHLCLDPAGQFRSLAKTSELQWSSAGDLLLAETNRPGTGYDLSRLAAELPDAWRTRLGPEVVDEVQSVLAQLPLADA